LMVSSSISLMLIDVYYHAFVWLLLK
jgi:hypothetical protein